MKVTPVPRPRVPTHRHQNSALWETHGARPRTFPARRVLVYCAGAQCPQYCRLINLYCNIRFALRNSLCAGIAYQSHQPIPLFVSSTFYPPFLNPLSSPGLVVVGYRVGGGPPASAERTVHPGDVRFSKDHYHPLSHIPWPYNDLNWPKGLKPSKKGENVKVVTILFLSRHF